MRAEKGSGANQRKAGSLRGGIRVFMAEILLISFITIHTSELQTWAQAQIVEHGQF
jgi:hypothetical protein